MAFSSKSRLLGQEDRLLFGRDPEIRVLDALLERLPASGSVLVVRGEAGIGKSALLTEARRRAEARGVRVLSVTGVRSEAKVGFAGLHQLLRPILGGAEELPRSQCDAMLAAFGMNDERAPNIFLIALAALSLLSESAGRVPLLLIVEDVHWLDRSTADVLAFVGRRLESDPIVLLIACRDGVENPLEDAGLPEITLGALDEASAAELLDVHAPGLPASVRRRMLAEAETHWRWSSCRSRLATPRPRMSLPGVLPLTERLERAFAARASDFPQATEAMLVAAALNESDSLPEIMAAASIVEGRGLVVDDFSPALAAGLVDVDTHTVRFRHPLCGRRFTRLLRSDDVMQSTPHSPQSSTINPSVACGTAPPRRSDPTKRWRRNSRLQRYARNDAAPSGRLQPVWRRRPGSLDRGAKGRGCCMPPSSRWSSGGETSSAGSYAKHPSAWTKQRCCFCSATARSTSTCAAAVSARGFAVDSKYETSARPESIDVT